MPTAYTAIIEENPDVTFRDYARRCVRAFGATILQRDDSLDAPLVMPEADDYHAKERIRAEASLKELRSASAAQIQALFDNSVRSAVDANAKYAKDAADKSRAYARMRTLVTSWDVPDTHAGLKKFMLEQIDLCYTPGEKPFAQPIPTSPDAFLHEQIDALEHQIKYYADGEVEERARSRERREWLETFLSLLPPA